MSDEEILHAKEDIAQKEKSARILLALAIVGLIINLIGATTFWIALPEKMRATTATLVDHEARIRATEARSSDQASTLVRIDERTKSIQDSIIDLKSAARDAKRP